MSEIMPSWSLVYLAMQLYSTGASIKDACPSGVHCASELASDVVSLLQVSRGSAILRRDAEDQATGSTVYPWSQRGRGPLTNSFTPFSGPTKFSAGPTWTWPNELDEQVRHSPLIDDNLDIYVTTATRIRKFNSDGTLLWTWNCSQEEGKIVSSPALYNGALFAVSRSGADALDAPTDIGTAPASVTMFSIDMRGGATIWKKKAPLQQNDDASSVFVYNNTMIVPLMKDPEHAQDTTERGNNIVYAVNSSDGSYLWEYVADDAFWNFAPATPGDGSLLFATNCGGVFRITFEGELIWRKGEAAPGRHCSSGGGSLGPNGVFYVEYDDVLHQDKAGARVAAYQVSDGSLLWKKTFGASENGMQYPAVGRLGSDGPLAVLVAIGQRPSPPSEANAVNGRISATPGSFDQPADDQSRGNNEESTDEQSEANLGQSADDQSGEDAEDRPDAELDGHAADEAQEEPTKKVPYWMKFADPEYRDAPASAFKRYPKWMNKVMKYALMQTVASEASSHQASHNSEPAPMKPALVNAVVALDATSGEVLWRFDETPWSEVAGAGESEKYQQRISRIEQDPRVDVLCLPDAQGIPVISGDGTVYTSSGHSGDLRAIRDVNSDGIIDPAETSVFRTQNCFLNSPSLAPGMLVAAPCWGPMYVFKTGMER